MRIITGKYKGRHFEVPRSFKARPTTDFAKENIFNVLRAYLDFDETRALDLFGGTGSISLELVSRGCPQVTTVEKKTASIFPLSRNVSVRWAMRPGIPFAPMPCVSSAVAHNLTTSSLPILPTRCPNLPNFLNVL